jgi:uncharacterized Zn finger protein (UPF0148 family)
MNDKVRKKFKRTKHSKEHLSTRCSLCGVQMFCKNGNWYCPNRERKVKPNDTIESLRAENAELRRNLEKQLFDHADTINEFTELKARWEKLKDFLRIDGNDWGTLETVLNYMQELESKKEANVKWQKEE